MNATNDDSRAVGRARTPSAVERFSIGKLALYTLGSGVIVLVISIPIILVLARQSALAGLIAAAVAVVVMVAVIGLVSRRMTADLQAEIDARRAASAGQKPPADNT